MAFATMRVVFVILVTIKLALLKRGFDVIVEKVEIPYYNPDYIGDPHFAFFKYRGTNGFNISAFVLQDLGEDEYGNVTVYKFAKNKYRYVPTNFHESPCTLLKNNILHIRDYARVANITKCPIRKGFYHINNFVVDLDKIPPQMAHMAPFGKYRICGSLYVSGTLIGTSCGQGELKSI